VQLTDSSVLPTSPCPVWQYANCRLCAGYVGARTTALERIDSTKKIRITLKIQTNSIMWELNTLFRCTPEQVEIVCISNYRRGLRDTRSGKETTK